jgi:hypothetical protein
MTHALRTSLSLFLSVLTQNNAQNTATSEPPRPLVLTEAIPTPGVQGRFDHFGFDGKNQLFVAALGNNSVEVIDISARLRAHSIPGFRIPKELSMPRTQKKFLWRAAKENCGYSTAATSTSSGKSIFMATSTICGTTRPRIAYT